MKISHRMSENSCSQTVSVDELCLKYLTCGRKRDANELPQLSIQMPLGTSMGRFSHTTTTNNIEGPPPAGSFTVSTIASQLSECIGTTGVFRQVECSDNSKNLNLWECLNYLQLLKILVVLAVMRMTHHRL